MAQKGAKLGQETISCSICLDHLKDPVTIPCGHNYCMNCIKSFWDGEDVKKIYSCPQCRQTFIPRPALLKNTMLAALVEELKKSGLQAAPSDHCFAEPGDVACDVCTGRKLKALKSCLVCLVSYCEKHLQPHFESSAFEKHKLVDPSKELPENICSRHTEVMKIFCRTDKQCICYLCSMDEHKGHDTVSAAAERAEKQKELEVSRQNIQRRIKDKEKDMEKLQQEISELKRKDGELMKLSHTEDHNQFLHSYFSLSAPSESTHLPSINVRPGSCHEDSITALATIREKLGVQRNNRPNTTVTVTEENNSHLNDLLDQLMKENRGHSGRGRGLRGTGKQQ